MPERKDLLLEAGLALASELSLPIVLQRIVDLAAQLTGARYGALGVLGPNGQITEFVTTGISAEQRRKIGHIPRGLGILGILIRDARPLRLERIADDPRSVGFPAHHPPMNTFLGAPVMAMGRVFGNLYLTEKRGGKPFTAQDEQDLMVLATQAGVAIANATLYEEARQQEGWLRALQQVNEAILAGTDTGEVLTLVCRLSVELAGADLATVAVPTGDGEGELRLIAAFGERAGRVLGMRIPSDHSLSGAVMRLGQPLVLENAKADERAHPPMVSSGDMGPSIFVPLQVEGRTWGALAIARGHERPPFPQDTVRLVESFARQASVAFEYARTRAAAERVAVLDDRERIAKELHDGIIQSLFAVGMGLQGAAALADQETAERIEAAVTEIDRVIRDLRNYIFGLRPGILADSRLDQALRTLAADFEQKAHVRVDVEIDPGVAAALTSRAADLVQLAREALSNVGRHAQADFCGLRLVRSTNGAALEVSDNGCGFDPARVRPGQGLGNMRARAQSLGGAMTVTSRPKAGTTLRFEVPL